MCTISWFYSGANYFVFFNRDEQKTRPLAYEPQIYTLDKLIEVDVTQEKSYQDNTARTVNTIMPIDPLGIGTWFATNEYGTTIALLNYYQGRLPKGKLKSRGLLVKTCSTFTSLQEFEFYFWQIDLQKFAPFTLLCFFATANKNPNGEVNAFRWTGKHLLQDVVQSPLFSSAVNYESVVSSRQHIYQNLQLHTLDEQARLNAHKKLHASHLPEKGASSICMHRDDAQTVSFSIVSVNTNKVMFEYNAGSACQPDVTTVVEIPRA